MDNFSQTNDDFLLIEIVNRKFIEELKSLIGAISLLKINISSGYSQKNFFFKELINLLDSPTQKHIHAIDNLVKHINLKAFILLSSFLGLLN